MSLNIIPLRPPSPPPEPMTGALPSFSIITPSLNRAEWIVGAIQSVLDQDYPHLQHIVADGGSTDGTLEYLGRFPAITVSPGPDKNSHHAINKALAMASGDVVGILNTDDLYPPGTLARVGRCFADDPHLLAIRGRCLLADKDHPPHMEILHDDDDLWGEVLFGTPGFNSWFFRRDYLTESLGGVNDRYVIAADRDLLIRMILNGVRPQTLDHEAYIYHRHSGSATLDQGSCQAQELLREHVTIALTLRRTASWNDRRRLDAFLAFEAWQLAVRLSRVGDWAAVVALMVRLGIWLPRWPMALLRARQWRLRLKSAWQPPANRA